MYGTPVTGPEGKSGMEGAAVINAASTVGFGIQLQDDPERFAKVLQVYDAMSSTYENYIESIFGTVAYIGLRGNHRLPRH